MRYLNEVRELGRWIDVYAFPTGEPGSRQLAVLFTDVTERMRMENEMMHATRVLQENDQRKNEFLAMLAHELRNPLAPLRFGLEVLHDKSDQDADILEVQDMMRRQVDQMVRLVDDLLDVGRATSGKITLHKEQVELNLLLRQAAAAMQPTMDALEQHLAVEVPDEPIFVHADPARLAQVVSNLLNNASKFSDRQGRVELSVRVDNGRVVVQVSDHGIGLREADMPRIFDLFTQVDSSLERSTTGLGIGLTLVRNLMQLHDGSVEVHSAGLGQGSTFTLTLPLMVDGPSAVVPGQSGTARTATRALKILVVDDNRDASELLTMILGRHRHVVRMAYDGMEALNLAAQFRPDVILLDIRLPNLNGYEVAKRIRQKEWGKATYLVALTGWGQPEDREKSFAAGFEKHLVKPVDTAVLLGLLTDLSR